MRNRFGLYLLLMFGVAALPAMADDIPYPASGSVAPTTTFTATATGNVTGYFFGASAADDDQVQLCDLTTGTCSAFAFDNHATAAGSSYDFGAVNAGDVLEVNLENLSTGYLLSSNPSNSADGLNHAYGTAYSGGVSGIPAGVFVGMEDLVKNAPSDFDYNDDQFVFTNVAVATPEPASVMMLLIGMLGVVGMRMKRRAVN